MTDLARAQLFQGLYSATEQGDLPLRCKMKTMSDDVEKSTVNHTVLTCSKQHLHNKKRRPYREQRCGAGQVSSETQVRTSHNSRVPERGKLCVPWLVRVLRLLW